MHNDDIRLTTERLRLRRWHLEDAPGMYDFAKNPRVGPWGGWKPHESIEESERILRELFLVRYDGFALTLADSGRIIGSIAFEEDPRRVWVGCRELGYALAEDCWGRGFMTEAARAMLAYGFENRGLSLISIYRDPRNRRSGRVIEKCGFVYEGTLRQAHPVYDGEIRDAACYSLRKEEWLAMREQGEQGDRASRANR